MSVSAWYSLPTDDATQSTTTVTASAADTSYPAANLITEDASNPAKLTTTSGNFVLNLGSARALVGMMLVYHNLNAALSVSIQLNASDSWGAPSFTQAITIPAHHEDGWPVSPYLLFASTQTYQYARLLIAGTNSYNVSVGKILLLTATHALPFARPGATEEEEHNIIVAKTEADVETIYSIGGKRRAWKGDIITTPTIAAQILTLRRACEGRRKPFAFVPFDNVNDGAYVRFDDAAQSRAFQAPNIQTIPISLRETARGVPFP